MKKLVCILLMLCLLLAACGPAETPTTEPSTEPTTEAPTTEPPTTEEPTTEAPAIRNPLNGQEIDAPYTGRIFACTINNVPAALPFQGVSKADIFFEMLVNDRATRGLAMFSDITAIPAVGSIRSTRYNFIDLCQSYDAILTYCGGSDSVLKDLRNSGVNHMYAGNDLGYRDRNRLNSGRYAIEHTMFASGQEMYDTAVRKGYDVERPAGADYGLDFVEDGTPNGEAATNILVYFWDKGTALLYDENTRKYNYREYGSIVTDETDGSNVAFTNVIIVRANVYNSGVYHIADIENEGKGFYACGGKIIPILWSHKDNTVPFTFTLEDGTPLEIGVGNTYIAIAPEVSEVTYE